MQTLSVNNAQLVDEIESALIAWFNPPLNKTQIKGKGYIAVRKVIDVKISFPGRSHSSSAGSGMWVEKLRPQLEWEITLTHEYTIIAPRI